MKKLLTICLLLATTFMLKAQDGKPTKEQTIAFIKRTFESLKGTNERTWILTENDFDEKYIFVKTESTSTIATISYRYTQLNWDKLYKVDLHDSDILLFFEIPLKNEMKSNTGNNEIEYVNYLQTRIPIDKYESLKKAFMRLAEIAKEENKDPFQN
jgi:phosphoribosylpyrophosphate synthetase